MDCMDYWNGLLDWTTRLDYWTGLLDYWTGIIYLVQCRREANLPSLTFGRHG